ncbi:hypothetical protein [Paenibacillus albus]|uniref:Uncharacterized protein n=1 Tax=Paenibacillus albus TaxID=2495582 RepID=A0A3Q8X3K3_9BACL|nr:hypothetical protein [Paenibacillus albus]AZN39333.1 hypothetical protein EJC50_06410 [Paenibacillus albus]
MHITFSDLWTYSIPEMIRRHDKRIHPRMEILHISELRMTDTTPLRGRFQIHINERQLRMAGSSSDDMMIDNWLYFLRRLFASLEAGDKFHRLCTGEQGGAIYHFEREGELLYLSVFYSSEDSSIEPGEEMEGWQRVAMTYESFQRGFLDFELRLFHVLKKYAPEGYRLYYKEDPPILKGLSLEDEDNEVETAAIMSVDRISAFNEEQAQIRNTLRKMRLLSTDHPLLYEWEEIAARMVEADPGEYKLSGAEEELLSRSYMSCLYHEVYMEPYPPDYSIEYAFLELAALERMNYLDPNGCEQRNTLLVSYDEILIQLQQRMMELDCYAREIDDKHLLHRCQPVMFHTMRLVCEGMNYNLASGFYGEKA